MIKRTQIHSQYTQRLSSVLVNILPTLASGGCGCHCCWKGMSNSLRFTLLEGLDSRPCSFHSCAVPPLKDWCLLLCIEDLVCAPQPPHQAYRGDANLWVKRIKEGGLQTRGDESWWCQDSHPNLIPSPADFWPHLVLCPQCHNAVVIRGVVIWVVGTSVCKASEEYWVTSG